MSSYGRLFGTKRVDIESTVVDLIAEEFRISGTSATWNGYRLLTTNDPGAPGPPGPEGPPGPQGPAGGGGDLVLAAFGITPNANGMTLTGGNTLQLQPASASSPGGVSTLDQSFGGVKSFSNGIQLGSPNQSLFNNYRESVSIGTLRDVNETAVLSDLNIGFTPTPLNQFPIFMTSIGSLTFVTIPAFSFNTDVPFGAFSIYQVEPDIPEGDGSMGLSGVRSFNFNNLQVNGIDHEAIIFPENFTVLRVDGLNMEGSISFARPATFVINTI